MFVAARAEVAFARQGMFDVRDGTITGCRIPADGLCSTFVTARSPADGPAKDTTAEHARELSEALEALGLERGGRRRPRGGRRDRDRPPRRRAGPPPPGRGVRAGRGLAGPRAADRRPHSPRAPARSCATAGGRGSTAGATCGSGSRGCGSRHGDRRRPATTPGARSTSPWTAGGPRDRRCTSSSTPNRRCRPGPIARDTGRSPGGTQEILNRFVAEGLIGQAPAGSRCCPTCSGRRPSHWPDDGWLPLVDGPCRGRGGRRRRASWSGWTSGRPPWAGPGSPLRGPPGAVLRARRRPASTAAAGRPRSVRRRPGCASPRCEWLPELRGVRARRARTRGGSPTPSCARCAWGPTGPRGREIVEDWGVVPG